MNIELLFKSIDKKNYVIIVALEDGKNINFIIGLENNNIIEEGEYNNCSLSLNKNGKYSLKSNNKIIIKDVTNIGELSGFITSFNNEGKINTIVSKGFNTKIGTRLVIEVLGKYGEEESETNIQEKTTL